MKVLSYNVLLIFQSGWYYLLSNYLIYYIMVVFIKYIKLYTTKFKIIFE